MIGFFIFQVDIRMFQVYGRLDFLSNVDQLYCVAVVQLMLIRYV